jgi:hypothetical protein
MEIFVGFEDFVEWQIAKPHRLPKRERHLGNVRPQIGHFAIEKDFPMSIQTLDIVKLEEAQEVMQCLAVTPEAGGFAGKTVEANERDVVAHGLDGAFQLVRIEQTSGKIEGDRDLEQILGLAPFTEFEGLITTLRGALKMLEPIKNRHCDEVGLLTGIRAQETIDQRQSFFIQAEVEESEGFFEFGLWFAKDHFRKNLGYRTGFLPICLKSISW